MAFDEKTIEEQQLFLIEQNKNQLEVEILLQESLLILGESESKLGDEIQKKEEFMNVMRQAANLHETKELQMRMMINLYEEKVRRLKFENWNEEDENDATKRQLRYLSEISKGTPVIMQVFQENLELKYAIENFTETVTENGQPSDANDFLSNAPDKLAKIAKNGTKATMDR